MEVETITMSKEDALAKLQEFSNQSRKQMTTEQKLLKKLYRSLAKGRRVFDVFETFKQPGAFAETGYPKIAIARVNWGRVSVEFETWGNSRMTFAKATQNWREASMAKFNIYIPTTSLPPLAEGAKRPDRKAETLVPLVPLDKQPTNPDIDNYPYYILFEVDKWELRAPKDPYLMRRVTNNLFVIEAKWNTTKLERAFINGRLV